MQQKSSHEINMLNGSLLPKVFQFALPLAGSGILQRLFNTADIVVLGQFVGSEAIAAVGSTGAITSLMIDLLTGLSVGVNVAVASAYARGKGEAVSKGVHTAISISLLAGVLLAVIGFFFSDPILRLMGNPDDVRPLAVTYMQIYFLGMPFILLYNFGSAILRSIGDTKRPLYYLFFSGIINVILNLVLVIVFDLGIAGVAIATVMSFVISGILVLRALSREDSSLKFEFSRLGIDRKSFFQIARVGLPAGIQSSLFDLSNVVVQSSVNSFGSVIMAGNSAAGNLEGFQYAAMNSVSQASISFASQNYAAGKYKRIDRVVLSCFAATVTVSLCFIVSYRLFGRSLLRLYSTDSEVIDAAMIKLMLWIATYFIVGLYEVMNGTLRGLGQSVIPLVISIICTIGFRMLWIFTIFRMNHDYRVLLWVYPFSWILNFLAAGTAYLLLRRKFPKEKPSDTSVL